MSSKKHSKSVDEKFDELKTTLSTEDIFSSVKENYEPAQHKRPSKAMKIAREGIDIIKGLLLIAAICAGVILAGYLLARSQPEIICKQIPVDGETVCKEGENGEWYFPR
ncbi:MAG: hypothetical protein U5K77_02465 [Candidatus Saccharibacteria bacterium]|nr:hypothetical protein [Candidatus Saccharibacteria bacterium]